MIGWLKCKLGFHDDETVTSHQCNSHWHTIVKCRRCGDVEDYTFDGLMPYALVNHPVHVFNALAKDALGERYDQDS